MGTKMLLANLLVDYVIYAPLQGDTDANDALVVAQLARSFQVYRNYADIRRVRVAVTRGMASFTPRYAAYFGR